MKDADEIVRLLKETKATLTGLQKKYRCSYSTIMRAILSRITKRQWIRLRKKILARGGVKTRFKKGHVPFSKGKKGLHLSPETEFKKGHLPANHKHVGTIRVVTRERKGNITRFREIKVSGILQGKHKWIPYARYLWLKENGPIPDGYFVVHINGDTLNDSLENLQIVNRSEHLALQKKRNPGWKKKAIRSYKKTVRERRRKKTRALKLAKAKLAKAQEQKQLEQKHREMVKSGIRTLRGPSIIWWECIGCGFESNDNSPPLPCPKCGGLNYEQIKQRRYVG
jgi:rubrerythrin